MSTKLCICLLLFGFSISGQLAFSQSYFNEVFLIEDFTINPNGLIEKEGRLLATYKYINPESLTVSTEIFTKDLLQNNRTEFHPFTSSRTGIILDENDILLMKESELSSELSIGFKILDDNLIQQQEYNYILPSPEGGNVRSMFHRKDFYLLNSLLYDDINDNVNIIKLDETKQIEWSIELDNEDQNMFPWEIIPSANDDFIISVKTSLNNSSKAFGQLYRLDANGEVIWTYTSRESTTFGNFPFYAVSLSDGNFIQSAQLDILLLGQYRFPPMLTWINPEGDFIKDTTFITTPGNHILTIRGLEEGKGDYFFVYGTEETGGDNSVKYGWLMKMDNIGNVIWSKNYKHPDYNNDRFHHIGHVRELDNGDIVSSGGILDDDNIMRLWLMKLNAEGCLNDFPCNDVVSSNENYSSSKKDLFLFPNPTSNTLSISQEVIYDNYILLDLIGNNYEVVFTDINLIDVSRLPSGMYILLAKKDDIIKAKSSFIKL